MAKLTYANKVALNQNVSIPDENKITYTNMNDIKSVTNENDDRLIAVETNYVGGNTQYGGTIVTNLNTISKGGFYTALGTATGVPNSSYSWFVTHQNSNTGTVSATQRAVAYSTDLIVYERVMQSSTWGAWVNRSTVNNLTTASAGNGVLDAYQGKVLNDKITNLTGVSLYDNDAGTAGTVTLSDSAANYNYLEIYFFNTSDNIYSSVKVYKPNDKSVDLTCGVFLGNQIFYKSVNRTISGTSISLRSESTDTDWSIVGSSTSALANAKIKIYKVVGYK